MVIDDSLRLSFNDQFGNAFTKAHDGSRDNVIDLPWLVG